MFALSMTSVLVPKVLGSVFKRKINPHQERVSCISAPGKVLIAGGYLVLEHPNLGISVATSSRFYTTVQPKLLTGSVPSYPNCITIIVDSPQFYEKYIYSYNIQTGAVTSKGAMTNEFVEKCISLTMAFVREFKEKDESGLKGIMNALAGTHYLSILLQAHNDFYSQIKEVRVHLFGTCLVFVFLRLVPSALFSYFSSRDGSSPFWPPPC
jgi:phosphomevalonate kinase